MSRMSNLTRRYRGAVSYYVMEFFGYVGTLVLAASLTFLLWLVLQSWR